MSEEEKPPEEDAPRDFTAWFTGRRMDVERWVEVTSLRAIATVRGVLADEIRGLSRRVERMHDLLDQLEQIVESPPGGAEEESTFDEKEDDTSDS